MDGATSQFSKGIFLLVRSPFPFFILHCKAGRYGMEIVATNFCTGPVATDKVKAKKIHLFSLLFYANKKNE